MKKKLNYRYYFLPKKLFKIIAISLIFNLLITLQLSANDFSQKSVSIHMQNATLNEIFNEISQQTGLIFLYSNEELDDSKKIDIDVDDSSIEEVMNYILNGKNLEFRLKENYLVISPTETKNSKIQMGNQRTIKISGTVIDEKTGETLIGVNLYTGDKLTGTATNRHGKFEFFIPDTTTFIFASFIGYKTKKIPIGNERVFTIKLAENVEDLEEVIITGYQEINRERMTGSVETISASSIENSSYNSIEEILDGRVPGLTVLSSGRPGEDEAITIRGINSLSGSTSPMWIVDGMPMQGELPNITVGGNSLQSTIFTTGIGNISADDIASITVLKDAAAAAIYGSRAANGVIVIKTKSGHVGKTHFKFSSSLSFTEKPSNNIPMMNTAQKIQYETELFEDEGMYSNLGRAYNILRAVSFAQITQEEGDALLSDLAKTNTDWFDAVFRNSFSQQYNLSMSGGNEKTQYYASGNYSTEEGIIPNNKYEKLGTHIKLTHNPSNKIRITLGLNMTSRKDRSTASNVNPLHYAMYANPYEKLYNEDGTYAYDLSYNVRESQNRDGLAWGKFNILHDLNNNTNISKYLNLESSLKIEYEMFSGLTLSTQMVYNKNSNHNTTIEGENTYTNFVNNWFNNYVTSGEITHDMVNGSLRESTGESEGYVFKNTINYIKKIKGKHYINLFAGQEISSRTAYNFYNYSPVFDEKHRIVGFPELEGIDADALNLEILGGTGKSVSKMSSFYANATYSYLDKYIFSGAIRYDGSDIIGNKNQFTPLGSISARWNLHNEEFIKKYSFINRLSLRGGFGYTGSIDKNAVPFLVIMYGSKINYDNILVPDDFTYPNPSVKWQTKKDIDIGLEVALFKNRLEFSAEYYHNTTSDVLDQKRLPYSSGREYVTMNVADILNEGWELSLTTKNIQTKDFTWITKFNLALNNNKILRTYYTELNEVPYSDYNAFVQDYPVSSWYGFRFAEIDKATGEVLVYTGEGDETFNIEQLKNTTLDIKPPDVSYLGKKHPPVSGGISSTFIYKRFFLTAYFDFKLGHMIRSFDTHTTIQPVNAHVSSLYRWRQPGDVTMIPAIDATSNAFSKYLFDINLEKGDYLRLNHITLGYNLNPKLISKFGLQTARVNIIARNLFTLSNYRGIDPTLMGSFGYPNTRSFALSLNLGF